MIATVFVIPVTEPFVASDLLSSDMMEELFKIGGAHSTTKCNKSNRE